MSSVSPERTSADDDPVRPHPQRVADEVADGDLAFPLEVRVRALQRNHMLLAELQLGGVLDGDDALAFGNVGGQNVQQRGFAAAGAAGYDDVEPALDAGLQESQHFGRGRTERQEVLGRDGILRKFPDRDHRADKRQRRNDDVHAGAVRSLASTIGLASSICRPRGDTILSMMFISCPYP